MLEHPDYDMLRRDIGDPQEMAPWTVQLLEVPDFELPPVPLSTMRELVQRRISSRQDTQLMEVIKDGKSESTDHDLPGELESGPEDGDSAS